MNDILPMMAQGFENAFTITNMLYICVGVTLGIIFGVLPGLGSVTALAVLVPITFYFTPLAAIAFLVGINKGGTSGGAIPAILINAPGTPEAAATAMDGYPLTQKGQPEKAMKTALYSSVCGDTFSDLVLICLAAPIAAIALRFGPIEFVTIILFSFTMIAALAGKSLLKGIIAAAFGLFLSMIGLDPVDSTERMTFGTLELFEGISVLPFAIGTLAMGSVISQLFDMRENPPEDLSEKIKGVKNYKADNKLTPLEFWRNWKTLLRSAAIGTGIGMLPGLGVTLAAFLGYGSAKKASKNGDKFGTGEIEGIQATEAANSAVVGSNLIPTIALGIPGNVAAAVLIGAFIIHGVVPGPLMIAEHGVLVYSIFASMLMANVAHLIIGRLGINIWAQFVRIPKAVVMPIVILLCIIGVFIPTNSMFEVGLLMFFALIGYLMRKSGFSIVCLVIGFLLGENFEIYMRQAILMNNGNLAVMFRSPIAVVFLLLTVYFTWHFGFRKPKPKTAEAAKTRS